MLLQFGNPSTSSKALAGTRSPTYYFDDGDIVVKVVAEDVLGLVNTLFRLHSFHLQTTTRYFDEALQPRDLDADVSKAFDVDDPIVLSDVNSEDFENLLWFFYDSAYIWSGVVDPSVTKKWESVLLLAEKFDMKKVAKVACHALGRAGVLQDVPRIALCVKYDMGKDWMLEGLKRLLLREEPLSVEEAVLLGPEVTAKLAAAREQVYRGHIDTTSCTVQSAVCQRCPRLTTCAGGLHICTDYGRILQPRTVQDNSLLDLVLTEPQEEIPKSEHDKHPSRQGEFFFKIEENIVCTHSYHFKRASPVFLDMLNLPSDQPFAEGRSAEHDPIALDVKKSDFDNMLWFFYDSPYHWSYKADAGLTPKWESILSIADMFDMEEVCRVATYALDHHGGLLDIRKPWALDALKNVCTRKDAITPAEARDMGLEMTALVSAAREKIILQRFSGATEVVIVPETTEKIVRETIIGSLPAFPA
ncbi:hypothetical protein BD626DRAFT_485450 [Schizophyllum amplum]|uniref:BTB domain-containing protein n=1 Tax=Schizophyllum amplum TaxID=97359 RepID=A0A550CLG4_9AGAR|nr:hypothetical protein BD626DRAFT_485450 [Auriculariopsis ampla]